VEEKWERLKRIVHGAMVKKRLKIKEKELGHRDWWDRRCTRGKRGVKKMYRWWRKRKRGERNRYIEEKKNFKGVLEVQKEKGIREEK